eukprot:m.464859 g.464859  ORF g.464859 m.464859 type:complete len:322 (-) comp23811_c0_seq1:79-1044(-)
MFGFIPLAVDPITSSPTQSPITSPSSSPTMAPTFSPTLTPTTSPSSSPTASPTMSPSSSPTMSPTFSPTVSPTASPTVPCSTLKHVFTLLEPTAKCSSPSTTGKGRTNQVVETDGDYNGQSKVGKSAKRFASEFNKAVEAWFEGASSNIFSGDVALHDVLQSLTVDGLFGPNMNDKPRLVTFTVEFKPESPIDHIALTHAMNSLVGGEFDVDGGQCTVGSVMVSDVQTMYELFNGKTAKTGKCKGGYTAKSSKSHKNAKKSNLMVSARTLSTRSSTVAISVGLCGVAVIGAALIGFRHRRHRGYSALSTPVSLDTTTPLLV